MDNDKQLEKIVKDAADRAREIDAASIVLVGGDDCGLRVAISGRGEQLLNMLISYLDMSDAQDEGKSQLLMLSAAKVVYNELLSKDKKEQVDRLVDQISVILSS